MLIRAVGRPLAADLRKLTLHVARRPASSALHTVTRHVRATLIYRAARRPVLIRTYATAGGATTGSTAGKKAKKAAPKKPKAKKKKKKPAAKKKPARKPKKVLTLAETRRVKALAWKKAALLSEEPKVQLTAYSLFSHERWHQGTASSKSSIGTRSKELSAEWKSLAASEKQHFEGRAVEERAARQQRHQAWVNAHTVAEIHTANLARRNLNALNKKLLAESSGKIYGVSSRLAPIKDERRLKRPGSAWTIYFTQHVKSSEFEGVPIPTRAKELSLRWKSLNASEAKPYHDQAATARETYQQASHAA